MPRSKRSVELIATLLPWLTVGFVSCEYSGVWDRLLGLDAVEEVAQRFDLSYAANASAPVYPHDVAWRPLLRLIYRYSNAKIPKSREPKVVARLVAVASFKEPIGNGGAVEWTAPSTPIVMSYLEWPGNEVPPADYRIVGTIGDLHAWISRYKSDLHSSVVDVFMVASSAVVGLYIWILGGTERQERKRKRNRNRTN